MTSSPDLPLFGRAGALGELAARIARAQQGVGSLVLVSGEAGVGKTTLCERVLADAAAAGHRTAWAGCWEATAIPALRPWSLLLGRITEDGGTALREVASSANPAGAQLAQFDALTRTLSRSAERQPLVLVIDDAHWADPATITLLAHVATVVRTMRVVLLVTYRPADVEPGTALGKHLPHLRRHAHELALTPLDEQSAAALLASKLEGADVGTGIERELARLAGGNPLFVTELARLAAARAFDHDGIPAIPPSARELLSTRLATVGPECARLLARAAVAGDEAPLAVLAESCAQSVPATLDGLAEALTSEIVRHRSDGVLEFAHPLFRAAVYGSLTMADRVALHAELGYALERLRANGHPVDPAALAHHFGRSSPLGTAGKAVRYAVEAGRDALRVAAYETAASRFRQALTAADLDPAANDRLTILLELGAAEAAAGGAAAATSTFAEAAKLARDNGRQADFARAALGYSGGTGIEVPINDPEVIELLTAALEALGATEPTLRAWLSARLSVALTISAPLARRAALADQAVALARTAGDDDALAHALAARCDVIAGPADVRTRQEHARRITELARGHGNVAVELLGGRLLVESLFEQGRLDEADLAVTSYYRTWRRLRDPRYGFYVPLWRGTLALARGDHARYATLRPEFEQLARAAGTENAATLGAVQELFTAVDVEPERALELFAAMRGEVTAFEPQIAVTTAYMHSLQGRPDQAQLLLEQVADAFAALPRDSEWLPASAQIAETAISLPDPSIGEWVYHALAPFGDLWSVEGIGAAVRGPIARVLGLLAARFGEHDAARTHFDQALAATIRSGATAWTERVERDAHRSLRRPARPAAPPEQTVPGICRHEATSGCSSSAGRPPG